MKNTHSTITVKGKDWGRVSGEAWKYLLNNRNSQILYYEDVAAHVGTNSRNVHRALAYIMEFCERNRLPPITGLVINKTVHRHQNRLMPGGGFRIHHADKFYYPESNGFEALYNQTLEDIKQVNWESIHYHPRLSNYLELKQYLHTQKHEKGKIPPPIGCLQQLARAARNK